MAGTPNPAATADPAGGLRGERAFPWLTVLLGRLGADPGRSGELRWFDQGVLT
jgi:hypothetical protein